MRIVVRRRQERKGKEPARSRLEGRLQLSELLSEGAGELGERAQSALSGDQRLHAEAQEGDHGQAAVLDLGGLELEGALGVLRSRQVQGVEVASYRYRTTGF